MEETHQESLIKLREDLKREEEKNIRRAVGQAREEEEERRHEMMQEQRVKERDRIQAAIEAEKRVLESQHGSVTQLQKVRSLSCPVSCRHVLSRHVSSHLVLSCLVMPCHVMSCPVLSCLVSC